MLFRAFLAVALCALALAQQGGEHFEDVRIPFGLQSCLPRCANFHVCSNRT
jgi:hypothetical protein